MHNVAMRFLIAPDKYKGTLSAQEAAHAIARGVRSACAERNITPELDLCPLSDGGEGFLDIMAQATGARIEHFDTTDPRGNTISVPVGFTGKDGNHAIVESALIIGLHLVPQDKRAPALLTTLGLGALLVQLAHKGCTKITIGLGGSATIDGGIGMAAALGYRFLDAHDNELPAIGASLPAIARIEGPRENVLNAMRITAACDVNNPLTGRHGAAHTYGEQKGATPAHINRLDEGLSTLRTQMSADDRPRFGAAGGLGFGLTVFAQSALESGAAVVLQAVRFHDRAERADLIITGEGSLDAQTARAKVCAEVASRADRPVIALPGRAAPDADTGAFALVRPCAPFDAPPPTSRTEAAERLTRAARSALLSFLDATKVP